MWLHGKAVVGILAAISVLTSFQMFRSPAQATGGLKRSLAVLGSSESTPKEIAQAVGDYRRALAEALPKLVRNSQAAAIGAGLMKSSYYTAQMFSDITTVRSSREIAPGLHRAGVGLPAIGEIVPGGANSPPSGYRIPLTVLALPQESSPDSFEVRFADPTRVDAVRTGERNHPVAMDLEAALDATKATGPRFLEGLRYLLRFDRKKSRLTFLQPYDSAKIPVVLIHGLISTPRMWASLVKELLAVPEIRERYQFWFFYYPTGQPIPLSALQPSGGTG
jgi:hypothetical protein